MSKNIFDLTEQYNQMLNRGIRLSGEDKQFFIRGRLRDLKAQLPPDFRPRRILDYGCGIGETAPFLANAFHGAEIIGVDTSELALAHAEKVYGSSRSVFRPARSFSDSEAFDLCYVNGVFHHIPSAERPDALKMIRKALKVGGYLALFENNPWNVMMRLAMSRIPFDHDAQMLAPPTLKRLVQDAGFSHCRPIRYLFYFPRFLAPLRVFEPWLVRLPFGAQYYVLAMK